HNRGGNKMAKKGKRYQEATKLIDRSKSYDIKEAVSVLKGTAKANFDETVEAAFRLGVDPKKADQQIRGAMVLPHGTGKTQRVLVFAKGDKVKEAEAAGADFSFFYFIAFCEYEYTLCFTSTVFAKGDKVKEAEAAGADFVGD